MDLYASWISNSYEEIKPCFNFIFWLTNSVNASVLEILAKSYYSAWVATQRPTATEVDLNNYLSLLTGDIGHRHLPYDPQSTRESVNKKKMLEGMSFYLGSHTKYEANLKAVMTGHNLVVKYSTESEGVHPQTKEIIKQEYDTVEVLEIENGKIAVIRKYSE